MKNLFSQLFGRRAEPLPEPTTADLLMLEKDLQALRIELEAREDSLRHLRQEVERLRLRQDQLVEETATARLEALFADLAGPASQLLTQADLLENQGKPVQAQDVLSVARRMVRALERHGVSFEGRPGQSDHFDPNRHTPLNNASSLAAGQPVTIRFAGAMFQGKVIYKSVVE